MTPGRQPQAIRATPRRRVRQRLAFTLIEMMVVVLIMALAATGASFALGALTRTQLRASAMKIAAGARFAYNRAIARGTTVRMSFDLDNETLAFEEGHGRVMLAPTNDRQRREVDHDSNADNAAIDPWQAAQARLGDTLHASFGSSPFTQLEGARYAAKRLASRVEITRVTSPHEPRPRTQGIGHIYFFPGGYSEHAVVWLSDGTTSMSIEVHPLTGRVKVHDGEYEIEEFLLDGEGHRSSEVRIR